MSVIKKDEITTYILDLLAQLASDWDYEEEISPASYLFGELGFQSLDAVILGNSIQEHYGCVIPYPDLFAEIGQSQAMGLAWQDFNDDGEVNLGEKAIQGVVVGVLRRY